MPLLTPPPTIPHTRANSHTPPLHKPLTLADVFPIAIPFPSIVSADSHPEDMNDKDQSPNQRGDKRRRVASRSNRQGGSDGYQPSPSKSYRLSQSPSSPHQSSSRRMHTTLPPIKPIGFAQSREYRRDDSGERPIPSPVVMGFDFKAIDEGQLKTVGLANDNLNKNQAKHLRLQVRDTISIRDQQQALIAARRKETVASQPATPKELTFKGWQPKDPSVIGVGKRREKTRATVEGMTINTGVSDMDHPGSKVSLSSPHEECDLHHRAPRWATD